VAQALQARGYTRDGAIVMRVHDTFCDWNDGTYRLEISGGEPSCIRVDEEPDVSMNASTLGALYMGGRDAISFAKAGRIDGTQEAVQRLNWLFRFSPEPWCAEIF
jgi:predicted acetyltransferase